MAVTVTTAAADAETTGMDGITEMAAAVGVMRIAAATVETAVATMMAIVAVMITTAAADAAAVMITGIGTMIGIEAVIHRLPGLEAIIPTGIPVDVKSSKASAGTYVSALFAGNHTVL